MFQPLLYLLPTISRAPGKVEPIFAFIALIFPFVLFFGYLAYMRWVANKWENGIFPSSTPNNRDNMMEAYICLAARVIRADRSDAKEKMKYLHIYFMEHFSDENYHFSDSLKFSLEHPIKLDTVGAWLNRFLSHEQRLQVMYFLFGLSYVDGLINAREWKILRELKEILSINEKDYQSLASMYEQRFEREQKKEYKRKQKTESPYRRKSALKLSSEILGVSESASMDEIKKAYRKLVKLHHPDSFATESEEQQKLAQARFIEIQKAYEVLEQLK